MVVLATLAAIIASQAMISGAFSICQQVCHLRALSLLRVAFRHDVAPFRVWSSCSP